MWVVIRDKANGELQMVSSLDAYDSDAYEIVRELQRAPHDHEEYCAATGKLRDHRAHVEPRMTDIERVVRSVVASELDKRASE